MHGERALLGQQVSEKALVTTLEPGNLQRRAELHLALNSLIALAIRSSPSAMESSSVV